MLPENATVSELIDPVTKWWNMQLIIKSIFCKEKAKIFNFFLKKIEKEIKKKKKEKRSQPPHWPPSFFLLFFLNLIIFKV